MTDHGKEFHTCVVEVLTKLDDGVALLKENIHSSSGKIKIGTIPILPTVFIRKNIGSYMNSFPEVCFDVFTCITNQEVVSGIMDGAYDVGFCFKEEVETDLNFDPMLR